MVEVFVQDVSITQGSYSRLFYPVDPVSLRQENDYLAIFPVVGVKQHPYPQILSDTLRNLQITFRLCAAKHQLFPDPD